MNPSETEIEEMLCKLIEDETQFQLQQEMNLFVDDLAYTNNFKQVSSTPRLPEFSDRIALESEILYLRNQLKNTKEKCESMARVQDLLFDALEEQGISTWDLRRGVKIEYNEETKAKLTEYLALGFSVQKLDDEIRENSAAADYWSKLLICLKLGDETGRFKNIGKKNG